MYGQFGENSKGCGQFVKHLLNITIEFKTVLEVITELRTAFLTKNCNQSTPLALATRSSSVERPYSSILRRPRIQYEHVFRTTLRQYDSKLSLIGVDVSLIIYAPTIALLRLETVSH